MYQEITKLLIFNLWNVKYRVSQKMEDSDFLLKSVLEVRFQFSTCVSESEFRARSIWVHYRYPFRIKNALKTRRSHARTWHFLQLSKVKFELSSLHQQSKPNLVCRHYYPWITLCVVMHCTKNMWSDLKVNRELFILQSMKSVIVDKMESWRTRWDSRYLAALSCPRMRF